MPNARLILSTIYMVVWGVVTIVIVARGDPIPAEYWTLPGLGVGGLLMALAGVDKVTKKTPNRSEDDK